jgi:rubrerythrin
MSAENVKLNQIMELCLNNEIVAVKKYTELAEKIDNELLKEIIKVEKQHIRTMNEIISMIKQKFQV